MYKCLVCKTEFNDKRYNCPKCGASAIKEVSSEVRSADPDQFDRVTDEAIPVKEEEKNKKSTTGKKVLSFLGIIAIVLLSLFGYGYWKASDQLKNGQLNMLTAGFTLNGMNPISAEGYRYFLMNRTDMPKRLEDIQGLF